MGRRPLDADAPPGTLLAAVGQDRALRLWRLPDPTPLAVLAGHTSRATNCAFSPDGALLATHWLRRRGTPVAGAHRRRSRDARVEQSRTALPPRICWQIIVSM